MLSLYAAVVVSTKAEKQAPLHKDARASKSSAFASEIFVVESKSTKSPCFASETFVAEMLTPTANIFCRFSYPSDLCQQLLQVILTCRCATAPAAGPRQSSQLQPPCHFFFFHPKHQHQQFKLGHRSSWQCRRHSCGQPDQQWGGHHCHFWLRSQW